MTRFENVRVFMRERVCLENSLGKWVTVYWRVRVQKQVVEVNDRYGGHRRVCEGDRARVGVNHGMVEVKLLCFRWLSPFLKLV
jgi:hypothetical protein